MKRFLNWLAVTVNPRYWLMNYALSPAWDAELRRLLDEGVPIVPVDEYEARIGPYRMWVANIPYAAFRPIPGTRFAGAAYNVRPTRRTIRLALQRMGEPEDPSEARVRRMIEGAST